MSTFTVAGIDLGDSAPATWSSDGSKCTVTGLLDRSSLAPFLIGVIQLQGIIENPDEPAVPVVASADSTLTGFYRVTGGDVDIRPDSYTTFNAPFTLQLERVPGLNSPLIESQLLGKLRTNSHSIAVGSTVPWWATPTDANADNVSGTSTATRTGDGGSVKVQYKTDGTLLMDTTVGQQCAPGDWMDMAARIEVNDGSEWRRVPGHQLATTDPATPFWRLTNDFVRVTNGGGNGLLSVQFYASSAWRTAKIFKLTTGTGPTTCGAFSSISVLYNAPWRTTVRLGLEQASTPNRMTCDLTLRRGALWVEGQLARDPLAGTTELGVYRNTAEAATAVTSAVVATSADAGGGKYWISTAKTKTNGLTQGGFYASTVANAVFDFRIGYEPSGASGPDTFTNQVYAGFAAVDESVRFVRR